MPRLFVYILAAAPRSTLYTGVTADLVRRAAEHRAGAVPGFTARYGVRRLVWFEAFDDPHTAIRQEKRIKRWRRGWKYDLVERTNPAWDDLFEAVVAGTLETWPASSLRPRAVAPDTTRAVAPDGEAEAPAPDPDPGGPGRQDGTADLARDRPGPGSPFGRPG